MKLSDRIMVMARARFKIFPIRPIRPRTSWDCMLGAETSARREMERSANLRLSASQLRLMAAAGAGRLLGNCLPIV
jgi:hypothetical protein